MPSIVAGALVNPKLQVKDLSDEQLNEEFTKALNANNPKAHSNMVNFVFKKGEFELEASVDQLAIHFQMEEYDQYGVGCECVCDRL